MTRLEKTFAQVNAADTHETDTEDLYGAPAVRAPWVTRSRPMGFILILLAAVGFIAAMDLSIEKVEKLENPAKVLTCDINPFFSCGSVMTHWQSQLFGFPNQFIGIFAFSVPLLLGILLVSGTQLPRWIMIGLNVGLLGGMAFITFLYISSIYVIGVGCPWCIVVWTITIPLFFFVTARNALNGNFGTKVAHNSLVWGLATNAILISVLVILAVYVSIVVRFWTYFGSLI